MSAGQGCIVSPNPSIERTCQGRFAPLAPPLMSNVRPHLSTSLSARSGSLFAWLGSALVVCAAYWSISIYVFGSYDSANGKTASFQIGLFFASLLVLAGLVGYVVALTMTQRYVRPRIASLSGASFALAALAVAFGVGSAFPVHNLWFVALGASSLLGALSLLLTSRRVA